jgi:hypothetical protein
MLLSLKAQRSLLLVNGTPVRIISCISRTESDGMNNHVSINKRFISNLHRCFECVQLLISNPPSITFGVFIKNRKNYINPPLVLGLFCSIAPYRFAPLLNLRSIFQINALRLAASYYTKHFYLVIISFLIYFL